MNKKKCFNSHYPQPNPHLRWAGIPPREKENQVRPSHQQSRQVDLGLVKDISKHNLSFSLEGYYKTMNNTLAYKEGATFLTFDDPGAA